MISTHVSLVALSVDVVLWSSVRTPLAEIELVGKLTFHSIPAHQIPMFVKAYVLVASFGVLSLDLHSTRGNRARGSVVI